jgi:hypothetical protein
MIFTFYLVMGTETASEILCVSNYECDNGIRTVLLPFEGNLCIIIPLRATERYLHIVLQVRLS